MQDLGYEPRTAYDGLAALELAEVFRPNIILMDLGMPKLNGYDAAKRIRKLEWGKDVLLIAITGWGQREDRTRTHEAGFDVHCVKPLTQKTLTDLLHQYDESQKSKSLPS